VLSETIDTFLKSAPSGRGSWAAGVITQALSGGLLLCHLDKKPVYQLGSFGCLILYAGTN